MDRSVRVCIVLLILIGTFFSSNWIVNQSETRIEIDENIVNQLEPSDALTLHEPIIIMADWVFLTQGWPGNGTSMNPYVIEGLKIVEDTECIKIKDTTVYFEVRNCIISSASASTFDGIVFDGVINGVIINCVISQHQYGINLDHSPNCTITNSTVFTNNNVDNSTLYSEYGIKLVYSDNCILTNNNVLGSGFGIDVWRSNNCTLMDNTLVGNGVTIGGWESSHWFHNVLGNIVNSKPLGYFKNITDTMIDGPQYGQVILVNCSEITIKDGIFTETSKGIQLGYCSNCTLTNNIASDNYYAGFYIVYSVNCTLINNFASNNFNGFYGTRIDNCTFVNNTAFNNAHGGFELGFANNCSLMNNTASSNSGSGFNLWSLTSCVVTNNTASSNSGSGFHLMHTDHCTLTLNTAIDNIYYGISIRDTSNHNILYLNRLGNNNKSNANDDGLFNSWDDGISSGNYWMDYNGIGPYIIPGDGGAVDNYPFVWGPVPTIPQIILFLGLVGAGIGVLVIVFLLKKKK